MRAGVTTRMQIYVDQHVAGTFKSHATFIHQKPVVLIIIVKA